MSIKLKMECMIEKDIGDCKCDVDYFSKIISDSYSYDSAMNFLISNMESVNDYLEKARIYQEVDTMQIHTITLTFNNSVEVYKAANYLQYSKEAGKIIFDDLSILDLDYKTFKEDCDEN